MPAFHRHVLYGVQHVLLDHVHDTRGGVLDGQPERACHHRAYRLAGGFDIQVQDAADRLPRTQAAEHQLGVRDRGSRAAAPIAGRAGIGTGPLRPHVKPAGVVDPGDRPAASAHGVDVDGGCRDVIAGDHDVVTHRDRAPGHQQDIARRATDLHRDQVARIGSLGNAVNGLPVQVQCADRGSRPAEQQTDGLLGNLVDRGGAAVRLQQQDRPGQTAGREFAVERAQIRHDHRQERRVDHSRGRTFVLAHERRHRCGRGDPLARPAFGERIRHRAFVRVVQETVHQAHGNGFDPFRLEVRDDVVKASKIERRDLASGGVDAPWNGLAQVTGDENRRVRHAVVELVLAQSAADL